MDQEKRKCSKNRTGAVVVVLVAAVIVVQMV
jgi:hypothetical protein